MLKLARSADGFFLEAHPKLRPVDTAMAGLFLAVPARGQKTSPKPLPRRAQQPLPHLSP